MNPRRLNKSELQKLYLFLVLLFVLGNLFLFGIVRRQIQDTSARLQKLRADQTYARAWLADTDLWMKRSEWLAQKQPKLQEPSQANVVLLESLQKLAAQNNLTILDQSLKDPSPTPHYREVSVQLRLSGSLEALCHWLAQVQQPEAFQAVTTFSLKSDGDDTGKVRCDLVVARWYAPH